MHTKVMKLLEFNKVKMQLSEYASTALGKQIALHLEPYTTLDAAIAAQEETDETLTVLRVKGDVSFGGIHDIRPALKRANIGGTLNEEELLEIANTGAGGRRVRNFLSRFVEEEEAELPLLMQLASKINPVLELEQEIRRCIDDDGHLRDSASPELRSIRQQLRAFVTNVRSRLDAIIRSSSNQKKLSDAIITIRNDRYVIPVKQEYRNSFGGIIHDQSASGSTLFIEPESIVTINNQLREAEGKEKQEIAKILASLTVKVAEYSSELMTNVSAVTELDFIFAKARYSRALQATKPKLNDEGKINLNQARHPLIPSAEVVPIDVTLGEEYTSLIVTGPNTGGKTVSLKTIGLLTLMAQSGLQLPVTDGSTAAVFEHVFVDIGDEQSIEQNLSTFSSHMTNIIAILKNINDNSLVLLDELGAGTDPQEGAALAISILDFVANKGASIVATTHYSELKAYAYNREGVINASVEFDSESLKPTYRLLVGVPGRSNAFEISKRLGLQQEIIQQAKSFISSDAVELDKMVTSLDEMKKQTEQQLREAERQRQEAEQLHNELSAKIVAFEQERTRMLRNAEDEAKRSIKKAQKEANQIIKELRENKSAHVKEHELIDAKKRLEEAQPNFASKSMYEVSRPSKTKIFETGDEVQVKSLAQRGTIIEKMNDDEYLVQIGVMKVNINADDMKKNERNEARERSFVGIKGTSAYTKREIDLRGKRYEEAQIEVERYLDEAMLAGHSTVSIIHGKGTGALRTSVQELLENHPSVKAARIGKAGEGGDGVTIVELK